MSYEKVFEIIKRGYLERINVIDYVAKARETSNSGHRLRVNGERRAKRRNFLKEIVL